MPARLGSHHESGSLPSTCIWTGRWHRAPPDQTLAVARTGVRLLPDATGQLFAQRRSLQPLLPGRTVFGAKSFQSQRGSSGGVVIRFKLTVKRDQVRLSYSPILRQDLGRLKTRGANLISLRGFSKPVSETPLWRSFHRGWTTGNPPEKRRKRARRSARAAGTQPTTKRRARSDAPLLALQSSAASANHRQCQDESRVARAHLDTAPWRGLQAASRSELPGRNHWPAGVGTVKRRKRRAPTRLQSGAVPRCARVALAAQTTLDAETAAP